MSKQANSQNNRIKIIIKNKDYLFTEEDKLSRSKVIIDFVSTSKRFRKAEKRSSFVGSVFIKQTKKIRKKPCNCFFHFYLFIYLFFHEFNFFFTLILRMYN
jgi:hypothetical protein